MWLSQFVEKSRDFLLIAKSFFLILVFLSVITTYYSVYTFHASNLFHHFIVVCIVGIASSSLIDLFFLILIIEQTERFCDLIVKCFS